jgi:hypothetical protein
MWSTANRKILYQEQDLPVPPQGLLSPELGDRKYLILNQPVCGILL